MPDPIKLKVYKQNKYGAILAHQPYEARALIPADESLDFTKDLQSFNSNQFIQGVTQYCLISPEDWASWLAELRIDDRIYGSGHTALTLAPPVNLDDPCPYALPFSAIQEDKHFELHPEFGLWHWESLHEYGDTADTLDTIGGAEGFAHRSDCKDDARNTIAIVSAYGVDNGFALINHYDWMMSRLWACDVEALHTAMKSVPLDNQGLAAYRMALRTKLMPEQYWPVQAGA